MPKIVITRRGIKRVSVLVIPLAALMIIFGDCFPSRAASPPTKVVIAQAANHPSVAPLWVAYDQGFFRKHGIEAEPVYVRGGSLLTASMVSGDIHIGLTAGEFLAAVARGVDFVVVATLAGKVTEDLVARPGLSHPSDLREKRFGIQSFGGGAWIKARLGLEYLGLDPERDRMRVLVIGDQALRVQSLEQGIIDVTTLSGIFSKKLIQKGFPILADFSHYNIPVMSAGVVVKNSYAQKHSDTLENVLKGLLEGLAFVVNPRNKPVVIRTLMKWLKISDPVVADEGYEDLLVRGTLERRPYPSVEGMRNTQRLMRVGDPRLSEIKVEDVIESKFMRRLDEIGFIDRLYRSYEATSSR